MPPRRPSSTPTAPPRATRRSATPVTAPAGLVGGVIVALEPLVNEPAVRRIRVRPPQVRPPQVRPPQVRPPRVRAVDASTPAEGVPVADLLAAHVDELGIRLGLRWTESLARRVAGFAATLAARRDAMMLLGRRAASSSRLIAKLIAIGHDADLAASTAAKLADDGWLDDRAHARAIALEIASRTPLSALGLAARLRRRGVDETLAGQVATEQLHGQGVDLHRDRERGDSSSELDACRGALDQLLRASTSRTTDALKIARRSAAALGRRGFDADDIRRACSERGLDLGS